MMVLVRLCDGSGRWCDDSAVEDQALMALGDVALLSCCSQFFSSSALPIVL